MLTRLQILKLLPIRTVTARRPVTATMIVIISQKLPKSSNHIIKSIQTQKEKKQKIKKIPSASLSSDPEKFSFSEDSVDEGRCFYSKPMAHINI